MTDQPSPSADSSFDVVVAGAGFGGMHALHRLREMGLRVRVLEAASDVGGVWFWNNYPGARCDINSLLYNYAFDPHLRRDYQYKWPEQYSDQRTILSYARDVADRYGLRRDIQFDTRVVSATWDDQQRRWTVTTGGGEILHASVFISAVGCLSAAATPALPGLESFAGDAYHTARWPETPIDFAGKRVALIGTGSSGVQAAPVIARTAAHLTVVQRTAQYCVPTRNSAYDVATVDAALAAFAAGAGNVGTSPDHPFWEGISGRDTFDDSPEQREEYFEHVWQTQPVRLFLAYRDTLTDATANEEAARFVRRKIAAVVRDAETAAKLMPDYAFGTKRQVMETGYYEMFNEPHVALEDVRSDPIVRVEADGIRLASGKLIEADIIVFATGFDAITGPVLQLGVTGRDGRRLDAEWADGPSAYLGLAVHGFPNMLILTGPGSPSVIGNVIANLEQQVEWITRFFDHLRSNTVAVFEPHADAQAAWTATVQELAEKTLFPQTDSWYVGANIPGKPRTFIPYLGGAGMYQAALRRSADSGYEDFLLQDRVTVAS